MMRRMTDVKIDLTLGEKLGKELEDGLLIYYRVKDHRLDFSLMNRPHPSLSSVDDHALATVIVYAGRNFEIVHDPKRGTPERVAREDGRSVTYNESIDIDFEARRIVSSRRKDMTLTVLEGIVADLIRRSPEPTPSLN
jgi:hypothetical protein